MFKFSFTLFFTAIAISVASHHRGIAALRCPDIIVAKELDEEFRKNIKTNAQTTYIRLLQERAPEHVDTSDLPYLRVTTDSKLPFSIFIEAGDAPMDFDTWHRESREIHHQNSVLFDDKRASFIQTLRSKKSEAVTLSEMKEVRDVILSKIDKALSQGKVLLAQAMTLIVYEVRHQMAIPYSYDMFVDMLEMEEMDQAIEYKLRDGSYGDPNKLDLLVGNAEMSKDKLELLIDHIWSARTSLAESLADAFAKSKEPKRKEAGQIWKRGAKRPTVLHEKDGSAAVSGTLNVRDEKKRK